nr:hypothetical protein [Tanacetum cinerariifolium]
MMIIIIHMSHQVFLVVIIVGDLTKLPSVDNQNVDFSGSDQIQTLQYPNVNLPSPEINLKELAEYDQSTSTYRPIFLNDNEDHHVQNRESPENSSEETVVLKTNQEPPQDSRRFDEVDSKFFEKFQLHTLRRKTTNLIPNQGNFFVIQGSQPDDSNELFQELLKDLKELAEYDQSTSTDRPIFLNDNEDHHVQNRESPENSSKETVVSKTNQEPPQDSDMHQLIEECSIEVPEEQK